jgi:hypothetical protein
VAFQAKHEPVRAALVLAFGVDPDLEVDLDLDFSHELESRRGVPGD